MAESKFNKPVSSEFNLYNSTKPIIFICNHVMNPSQQKNTLTFNSSKETKGVLFFYRLSVMSGSSNPSFARALCFFRTGTNPFINIKDSNFGNSISDYVFVDGDNHIKLKHSYDNSFMYNYGDACFMFFDYDLNNPPTIDDFVYSYIK